MVEAGSIVIDVLPIRMVAIIDGLVWMAEFIRISVHSEVL